MGIGQSHSVGAFCLVGTLRFDADLLGDAKQLDPARGHVDKLVNYDIFITQWSDLIEAAERRLEFFREQPKLEICQDEAARRLRERHGDLMFCANIKKRCRYRSDFRYGRLGVSAPPPQVTVVL